MNVPHGDVDAGETAAADPVGTDRGGVSPAGSVPAEPRPADMAPAEAVPAGSGRRAEEVDVRYWAAARAAAGVDAERVPAPATVAELLATLVAARPALAPVLPVCSVLVDGRACRGDDAVPAGCVVEILPPFAGG
ncbi:MAG: MoaD/ThiS family protein [Phycicoccus sp.]